MSGTLYLIPVALGDTPTNHILPADTCQQAHRLGHFIVESAKTARQELKRLQHPTPLRELGISEIPPKPRTSDLDSLLAPLLAGEDVGLMSDAGCPAVADPGALVVRRAHERGLRVAPLVGPSSLLLALMGSGLDGQRFAFHGYLPVDAQQRHKALRTLENESRQRQQTQLFIETPYRNDKFFAALLDTLQADTRVCVARALTTADEWLCTRRVADWRRQPPPTLDRLPTVFLLLA